ncbi:NadS family protein [Cronobacter dublinensis]|uniref:MerR family bacterial regulatory protein n=1 Tax=Cronobacter dublinensis 1210 TaxID=1208656 RepID=A0ABP1W427_9ENTR|nr:NadS family protein [Cronobacter dublinensis]EGT5713190.1 helix-turn-helix domain-containing protein [Cronobacter dublinensis subsp. dublinensis]CCJ79661.1 putative merR family bacterial regulatory protein [Cronobacter dublinensis 1210]ALB68750.1 Cro/Cl family transcriptional regulator [Cronobacter dublinensis subsp. dublinensis LMG 23823]EGT4381384.1 helix-turn-helix domain-containing protein [Cronobacter dublinensis]EGT5737251.1 helix-turn-helix domain-containing protein [Cronobacter dubl
MDKALFEQLAASMRQMNEIDEGSREPSRTFTIDALKIKEIRQASGLSQTKFASLIAVSVDTLRNWEQGRRSPTGPARALLRAIARDPQHVIPALAS